jgi:D-lactate dehydrogenase (cytochrome)
MAKAALCPPDADTASALDALSKLLGERLSTSLPVRVQHADDPTWNPALPADAVAFPENEREVVEIVRICAAHHVPIVPYGAGTSLEGHIAAPCGGICVDFSRMNEILEVSPEDLDCRVQPGVTRRQLNSYIRDTGLFFPIDPGADATIGGMVSTRASGTNAVRYGTMAENVKALRVVTARGEILTAGTRARKSAAGYDLVHLFAGAEGTLGLITEITLRLHGIPEAIVAGVCNFPTVRSACEAVIETIQSAIPVARIELLDEATIATVNAYSHLELPERPTLFIEVHGTQGSAREQIELFLEIAQAHGGSPGNWAEREEDRSRLWRARHDAFWAAKAAHPGQVAMTTDVCVPISRLADCVTETQADMRAHGLEGPIVGHVGDGNFHVILFSPPEDEARKAAITAFAERLAERAIAMGGTITGEHGIGMGKLKFMRKQHGPAAIAAMQAIKHAFDPHNIFNPCKVVPM